MTDHVLLIDKHAGPTSHDVVLWLRRVLGVRRVGHTGTLDPFATGLLVCLTGGATRLAPYLADLDKEYTGRLCLGVATDSGDQTGKVVERKPVPGGWERGLDAATRALTGPLDQVPPMTSARRVGGRRLYDLARAGLVVERAASRVHVHEFETTVVGPAETAIRVRCSKGTYIRTLAAQLGEELGTAAHLTTLRRTAVGPLRVERAFPSHLLAGAAASDEAARAVIKQRLLEEAAVAPGSALAGWPLVTVDHRAADGLKHGRAPDLDSVLTAEGGLAPGERVRLAGPGGEFLALAEVDARSGCAPPADQEEARVFRLLRVMSGAV